MREFFKWLVFSLAFLTFSTILILSCSTVNADKPSNFDLALKVVLEHEGGLSNDKNDPGGITKYGISLRYLRAEHIDINHDGKVDKNDVIYLTQTEADYIYYMDWWKRYHFDKFKDLNISTKLFDTSVNTGISRTAKLTKKALNRFINGVVLVDGNLDSKTIDMINNVHSAIFLDAFRAEEEEFYRNIVKRNPKLRVFLPGWLNRVKS